jgi:hypothetical protein
MHLVMEANDAIGGTLFTKWREVCFHAHHVEENLKVTDPYRLQIIKTIGNIKYYEGALAASTSAKVIVTELSDTIVGFRTANGSIAHTSISYQNEDEQLKRAWQGMSNSLMYFYGLCCERTRL